MFFKKKNKERKKPQDCKVHFKAKNFKRNVPRRKNSSNKSFCVKTKPIKPLRGARNSRAEKVKKIKRRNSILGILLVFLIIFIAIFSGYTVINFITGIRGGTSIDDIAQEQKYVIGIDSIPIYPNSQFVYQDRMDEEIVMRMLNQGLSVYKLPRNTRTSDVYSFYEEVLSPSDWEYIKTIPISTDEELLGQYWYQNEKGLRIYVENNDVWYELITKDEAETSLAERREAELQRKRVLETSSEQNLLPDYPWVLSIPREYLTRYSPTDMDELQSVEIFEISGEASFLIYPIGKSGDGTYIQMLEEFIEKKDEDSEEDWGIISSVVDNRKDREVLTAKLTIDGNNGEGIVLLNKRNFIVYLISSNEDGHPFFEQIIDEIQEP